MPEIPGGSNQARYRSFLPRLLATGIAAVVPGTGGRRNRLDADATPCHVAARSTSGVPMPTAPELRARAVHGPQYRPSRRRFQRGDHSMAYVRQASAARARPPFICGRGQERCLVLAQSSHEPCRKCMTTVREQPVCEPDDLCTGFPVRNFHRDRYRESDRDTRLPTISHPRSTGQCGAPLRRTEPGLLCRPIFRVDLYPALTRTSGALPPVLVAAIRHVRAGCS